MILFQRFIEILKVSDPDPNLAAKASSVLKSALTDYRPFVYILDGDLESDFGFEYNEEEGISLPFKKCFFELSSNSEGLVQPIFGFKKEEDDITFAVLGVYAEELSPTEIEVGALLHVSSDKNAGAAHKVSLAIEGQVKTTILAKIQFLLNMLSTSEVAECHPRVALKAKINGEKLKGRINTVVFVGPKKDRELMKSISPYPLTFTHRWRVRGHWRKLRDHRSVGKDRESNLIFGHTWVVPHVRGPEEAVLVEKTRVFKDCQNSTTTFSNTPQFPQI